ATDLTITESTSWDAGTHIYNNLTISNNSTLTLASNTTDGTGVIIQAASITIDSGSAITASGQGYAGGAAGANGVGDGAGLGSATGGGGGASYGGAGAAGVDGGAAGATYGSFTEPVSLGSGGGGGAAGAGGAGGGAIKLVATGTVTVNGSITANGVDGTSAAGSGGAGSGGSILITCADFAGTGSITANGGNGGSTASAGGGAGGGRIKIYYTGTNTSSLSALTAAAGSNGSGSAADGTASAVQGGTIFYDIPNPTPQSAGVGWSETITAKDAYGNTYDTDATITVSADLTSAVPGPDTTTKRKAITITGSTAGALTDYQVQVAVAYDANMNADFSDIRFADADGDSLSYYRDSYTASTSAVFWVKVPSIPASPDTTTLYLYYGNSALATASNGANTFLSFNLRPEGIIAGGEAFSCALVAGGSAMCWGYNGAGQLGNGTTTRSTTPVSVSGLTGAVGISGGQYFACVVLSDGTAKCWGENNNGQLGIGSTSNQSVPVLVSGLSSVVSIAAGLVHTCAAISDGTARCWGSNDQGRLGNGSTTQSTVPVVVSNLSGAVTMSAGKYHSCALLSNGTGKCWGDNGSGMLGDGTTTTSYVPVTVSGLTGATAIASGEAHTCALINDGTAKCWGYGGSGQLGNGTTSNKTVPTAVSGLTGAVAITAGYGHSCALLSNGTAKCWGHNGNGRLGDGTTTQSNVPVAVSGLTGAVAITGGLYHTCALLSDGSGKCWGTNVEGELGNGTTTASSVPVSVSSNYNLGAVYGKSGSIAYLRKYASSEPAIGAAGSEEALAGLSSVLFYTNNNYTTPTTTYSLTDGLVTIYAKDTVAETIYLAATDGTNSSVSGSIVVNPASIDHYTVSATTPQLVGTGWSETVSAINTLGTVAVEDSTTVITASSSSATTKFYTDATYGTENTSKQYTLSSGLATIYVKDNSSGTITITVTDANSKTGTSSSIVVAPGAFSEYVITTTTPQTAGVGWSETLSSKDSYGNINPLDTTITISGDLSTASPGPDSTPRRKAIAITGSTAGALTDYQVQVSVTYDADMNADFSDVRFADASGAALSYYRQAYAASTSAVFWVKVPSIPASPDTTTIYLYYGDTSLSTTSSGSGTFINYNL
ncbi:MAG: DUF2341 domain-containing protein, partial [Dehalococcoidia bacterium]